MCEKSFILMRSPPGTVLQCAAYDNMLPGTHFIQDAAFVLLDDGTIWQWQFVPGQGAMMIIAFGGLISLFVGLTLAVFMSAREGKSKIKTFA